MIIEKVMNNYIEVVQNNFFIFLTVILSLTLVVSTIDYLLGWINAKFNRNVVFESNIALYGIIKKMTYFIILIVFMFIAYAVAPETIANSTLTVLYLGYLVSELNSVFSHLDLTDDGKHNEPFKLFIERIIKRGIDKNE